MFFHPYVGLKLYKHGLWYTCWVSTVDYSVTRPSKGKLTVTSLGDSKRTQIDVLWVLLENEDSYQKTDRCN